MPKLSTEQKAAARETAAAKAAAAKAARETAKAAAPASDAPAPETLTIAARRRAKFDAGVAHAASARSSTRPNIALDASYLDRIDGEASLPTQTLEYLAGIRAQYGEKPFVALADDNKRIARCIRAGVIVVVSGGFESRDASGVKRLTEAAGEILLLRALPKAKA